MPDRFELPTIAEERARERGGVNGDEYTFEECADMDAALEQAAIDLRATAGDFIAWMPEGFKVAEPTAPTHLPKSPRHGFLYDEMDFFTDIQRLVKLAGLLKGRTR